MSVQLGGRSTHDIRVDGGVCAGANPVGRRSGFAGLLKEGECTQLGVYCVLVNE